VGGLLLGVAGLIRPVAAFAAAGMLVLQLAQGHRRRAASFAICAAVVAAAGIVGVHRFLGDPLHGVRAYTTEPGAYNGQIFTFPFSSLILTPLSDPGAMRRVPYIAIHVALALLSVVILLQSLRGSRSSSPTRDRSFVLLCAPWLLLNTLFVLCIGSHWGFDHFPRFLIPAQPALLFVWQRLMPRSLWPWLALATATGIMGMLGVRSSP
jgi:hypothetical protein